MENTATFEEFFKDKEPTLLYNMKQFKFWDYIDEINKEYTEQLQAKHEEELKQAVVDAIKTDVFPLMDEANFIAKNLKDNPYCTVYRLHELNKNIEDKYGIEIEYTPTGKL